MDKWKFYGKSGNPSSDIARAWLKNNGIPVEENSIFQLTKEEIERLSRITPGGVKKLIYPDTFSFMLINPQKKTEKVHIESIQKGELSDVEIVELVANYPALVMTPIITNYDKVLIGYDLETIVSKFRFVKIKDVTMA